MGRTPNPSPQFYRTSGEEYLKCVSDLLQGGCANNKGSWPRCLSCAIVRVPHSSETRGEKLPNVDGSVASVSLLTQECGSFFAGPLSASAADLAAPHVCSLEAAFPPLRPHQSVGEAVTAVCDAGDRECLQYRRCGWGGCWRPAMASGILARLFNGSVRYN